MSPGSVAEWPKAPDCESGAGSLRYSPWVRIPPLPFPVAVKVRPRLSAFLPVAQIATLPSMAFLVKGGQRAIHATHTTQTIRR
jgi:hypothetical protein